MSATAEEFDDYATRVRDYGRTWFLSDDSALGVLRRSNRSRAVAAALAACGKTVGTDILYLVQPDRWTPERSNVHADLIDHIMIDAGLLPEDSDTVLPIAVLLMGLPGSGKSSALRPMAQELCNRVDPKARRLVDADSVRALLPEYAGGLGSEVVQVETAYVTYRRVVEETYRRRGHVVIDTVGDPQRSIEEIEFLTESGWTVCCLCASLDTESAVQRAKDRALTDGRYVSIDYLRSIGDRPIRSYEAIRESSIPLIGAALLSTDVVFGSPPVVLDCDNEELFGPIGDPTTLWPCEEATEAAS